jgi:hypothetical protein
MDARLREGNMKLKQIVNSAEAFGKLMKQPMKAKIAFRLGKTLQKVKKELKAYDDAKNKLIEQLGKEKDGQKSISPEDKNWKKFIDEINDLLDEPVKIKFEKVKLSQIPKAEISPEDAVLLDWLLEE